FLRGGGCGHGEARPRGVPARRRRRAGVSAVARVEFCAPEPAETAERPIRIFLNEVPVSQGSPYGLRELAVGYLLSEGLIADRERLVEVVEDAERSEVRVASGEHAVRGYVPLHRVTSAGCAKSALLAGDACIGAPARLES